MLTFLAMCLAQYALSPPLPDRAPPLVPDKYDCQHKPLPTCTHGRTGPHCDLECISGRPCDYTLYCHSWGATYGLSIAGGHLFSASPAWPSGRVADELSRFIVEHPDSLGLDPGIAAGHLGLTPQYNFRADAGALELLRFDQTYRGLPIFGPDAVVKLIATREGILGLRGAIVDGRVEFEHAAAPSTAESAAASIRLHVAQQTGLPPAALELHGLRLVAVPRARAVGWAASVEHGLAHVATVVVAASRPATGAHAKLLYFEDDVDAGLADEVPVTVLAEDRASDVTSDPVTALSQSLLGDGSALVGSMKEEEDLVVLGTDRVVAYDAVAATHSSLLRDIPPLSGPEASFQAAPGSREFRVQDTYVATQNFHAWTDRFMAGRWDSHLGAASSFPPGTFSPRLMVYENVGYEICGPHSYCAGFNAISLEANFPLEYKQALDGNTLETIGWFAVEDTAGVTAATLAHEFGHFIDYFAQPGAISTGFGCQNCVASCEPDTTDESGALNESFANFTALWLLRDLYALGQSPTSCAVTQEVSHGGNSTPHMQGCTNGGTARVALFLPSSDPSCAGFGCDGFEPEDSAPKTGLCSADRGYRIDSFHQALWESLHARTCDVSAPYTCSPRPALLSDPAGDIIGGAMLYALRVNTATYRGFADDMATYISCNHGEAAYQAFNEIFCHHQIRACDAPTPAVCETCGNGVREGDEACDGTDLGGLSCEKLGFAGGALMCDDDCTLDESACVADIPTTGGDPADPSPGGSTGIELNPESDTADPVAGDGCGCTSATSPSWLTALLGAACLRRRRRATLGLVALCASLTSQLGCGPEPGNESDASTSGSSTGPAMSTGDAPAEVSPRMFGKFHEDQNYAGYTYKLPEGDILGYGWTILQIHQDGTLVVTTHVCDDFTDTPQRFAWVHIGGDVLQIVPDEYFDDGTFRFIYSSVSAVTLLPGPGCDDLVLAIEEQHYDKKITVNYGFLPGELCTESNSEEDCDFTFVWCDGAAPPACVEGDGT